MKRTVPILALLLLLFVFQGWAQNVQLGVNWRGFVPQGDFESTIGHGSVIGGDFFVGYTPQSFPLTVGVELGIMNYGNTRRSANFSPNIPEVQVDVVTSNNVFTGHAVLRYLHQAGAIRPYGDLLLGFNHLFTRSRVTNDDNESEVAGDVNQHDTALSYGVGGGVQILIREYENRDEQGEPNPFRMLLDVKLRYLLGGTANYLDESDLQVVDNLLAPDTTTQTIRRSSTDLFTIGIGLIFEF